MTHPHPHRTSHTSHPHPARAANAAHAAHAADGCDAHGGCCAPAAPVGVAAGCCDHGHGQDHGHDHGPAPAAPAADPQWPADGRSFRVPTMDCAVEEAEIRRALEPMPGVTGLRFHLGRRLLRIEAGAEALPEALAALRRAGFAPQPLAAGPGATAVPAGDGVGTLAAALGLALLAELCHFFAPDALPWRLLGMAIAVGAIALSGVQTYTKGLAALRHGRLNINALMTVAVTGAFLIGQWPEAAMVMALYAIAEKIEARAADRARNAIAGLLDLAPPTAELRQPDGRWVRVPTAEVQPGALVRVRPGERVVLDGRVVHGESSIDQSPVTGESIPVDKRPGDPVYAGTVNAHGELEFEVTAVAADTTLARIIHAVEQAQGSRAPTQRFVDRFAAVYTPAVFALALAVALLPPLLLQWTWLDAVYKALVLLVIACPCALVISTPVTIVSALAAAARRGVLVKGGVHLEAARGLKVVALDKTGTLTEGRPRLVQAAAWGGADEARVRRLAHALAARSDHPVSAALAAGLAPGAQDAPSPSIEGVTALPGRGVSARVDSQPLVLGNLRLMRERGQASPALEEALNTLESEGRTVTLLADEDDVLGVFAVADTVRADTPGAIADLRALGVRAVMLSGDNPETARAIGRACGIEDARGGLLPQDKLAALDELRRHGPTAMAGDGINDAPALARADIGFAMGGAGTDIAMEAADVVIMNDKLSRIAETIRLSRRTHAVLWQNISLALGIKAVFFVLALAGSATLWMAVFADMGASLLVVANGLRLLRGAAPRDAGSAG